MGPSTKFADEEAFLKAILVCLQYLHATEFAVDSFSKTINFSSVKAEERYSIAISALESENDTSRD
jgi:hypothetical protein